MSTAARQLVAVSAGLSQPSSTRLLADRMADATRSSLAGQQPPVEVEVEVIELRDLAQDLVNNLLTGFPGPRLGEVVERVMAADAVIAVSPIFNASYSGLFKLFWDVLERDRLRGMPVLIGATGGSTRHSLALEHTLRPLFAYLGADVMPTAVYAAAEDWGRSDSPADAELPERIARAADELARAIVLHDRRVQADPFVDPVPFEQLLDGASTPRPRVG